MSKTIRERNTRSPVLKAIITNPVTNEVVFIKTQKEIVLAAVALKNVSAEQREPPSEFIHFSKSLAIM